MYNTHTLLGEKHSSWTLIVMDYRTTNKGPWELLSQLRSPW